MNLLNGRIILIYVSSAIQQEMVLLNVVNLQLGWDGAECFKFANKTATPCQIEFRGSLN